jgi:hypothetical protein
MKSLPVLFINAQKPNPSPTHKLNIGPAKHAVVAIVDNPFLDRVKFATRSCIEFPKARTVRPRTVEGISSTMPKSSKISTSLSAMESSQVAAIAKPKRVSGTYDDKTRHVSATSRGIRFGDPQHHTALKYTNIGITHDRSALLLLTTM